MNRFFTLLLAASCLTAVGQVPEYVPTDGLVAWYPLSENGDDASGNGNHLVQIGSPDWLVDGVRAYCEFDGEGTHFYHPEASFPEVEALTISFWTRLDVFSAGSGVGSIRPLVSKHYSSPAGSFILHARIDGIRGTYAEPHTLELDTWYHVTCVFSDVIKLYIDGQIVNEAESPTNGWNATDYPFMVGGWLNQPWWSNNWSNSALSFDGGLSSIGLWSRVLDDEEIVLLTNPEQGCMHDQACNYNELAVVDNNSCDFVSCHCLTGTVWSEELGGCIGDGSGDINLDGCVQLNDLLDLLSAYGNCSAEESAWQCGDPLEYQGYDYETVQIGEQCWFAENLRTELYQNGDTITHSLSDEEWINTSFGARAIYGEDIGCSDGAPNIDACDPAQSLMQNGRLYNFYAVTNAAKLCPPSWHVSSDADWMELESFAGLEDSLLQEFGWRGDNQSYSLKAEFGWADDWNLGFGGGENLYGFTALPAGDRHPSTGHFSNAGYDARFWTSTIAETSQDPITRRLVSYNNFLIRETTPANSGWSVRCIKDTE